MDFNKREVLRELLIQVHRDTINAILYPEIENMSETVRESRRMQFMNQALQNMNMARQIYYFASDFKLILSFRVFEANFDALTQIFLLGQHDYHRNLNNFNDAEKEMERELSSEG